MLQAIDSSLTVFNPNNNQNILNHGSQTVVFALL